MDKRAHKNFLQLSLNSLQMLKIRTSERSILMLLINRIAGFGEENDCEQREQN